MVAIGKSLNRDTRAILTDMEQPLGLAIGNSLEVQEAVLTLKNKGPSDLVNLCLEAGAIMLVQGKVVSTLDEGRKKLQEVLENGQAFLKLKEMVVAQGGDVTYLDDLSKFPTAKNIIALKSKKAGYISKIEALTIGECAMRLGAGRKTYADKIDMAAGIVLKKKVGDRVEVGEVLCVLETNGDEYIHILEDVLKAFIIVDKKVSLPPIVHEYIK